MLYILWYPLVTVNHVLVEFVMMDMVFIPERLKGIREERNLSKAAAARLLNLSKMGYLRYETGDRTPSYQTIVFMAQKLGTSPEYLTGKENTLHFAPPSGHRCVCQRPPSVASGRG